MAAPLPSVRLAAGGWDSAIWLIGLVGLALLGVACFRWLMSSRVTINVPSVQSKTQVTFGERRSSDSLGLLADRLGQTMMLKLLSGDASALAGLSDLVLKSTGFDASSPFAVVMQVRAALSAGQLESVRQLLSERLYQRWNAAPPTPPPATLDNLVMSATTRSGADPNRIVIQTAGGIVIPGATREAWHLVRGGAAPALPADSATPAPAQAPAAGWIVDDVDAAQPMAA
jgi:hypothetical protein